MHVLGVLNGKGGVGKTTLTACLAVRAAADPGARVAVIDLDPANSYAEWYARRGAPDNPTLFRGVDRASDAVEALQQTSPYNYVLFDGPPNSVLVTEDAIRVSTLVLIPIRPSGLDIGSSRDTIQMCQDEGTPYLVVINGKGQHDGRLVEEARALLKSWKVPVAEQVIAHRVQMINAMTTGKTGPERDRDAKAEIETLWGEVKTALRKAARRARAR
jgi:chromosome partitioning protein